MISGAPFRQLCDELHVLPQTPPWQPAVEGCQLLAADTLGGGNSSELEERLLRLTEFVQMLRDNLDAIGPVLLNAAFLAGLRPGGDLASTMPPALRLLASGLQFDAIDTHRVAMAMQSLQALLRAQGVELPSPPILSRQSGQLVSGGELHLAYEQGRAFSAARAWPVSVARAWHQLAARLTAADRQGTALNAGFDEIICAAHATGPVSFIPLRPDDAPLPAWTQLLLATLHGRGSTAADAVVPFEMAAHALLRLGFGRFDPHWTESLCDRMQAAAGASAQEGSALRNALFESRAMQREPAARGAVVFVRRDEESISQAWRSVPTRAWFLVLTPAEFQQELQRTPPLFGSPPSPMRFVLERGEDDGGLEAGLREAVAKLRHGELVGLDSKWASSFQHPSGADALAMSLPPIASAR